MAYSYDDWNWFLLAVRGSSYQGRKTAFPPARCINHLPVWRCSVSTSNTPALHRGPVGNVFTMVVTSYTTFLETAMQHGTLAVRHFTSGPLSAPKSGARLQCGLVIVDASAVGYVPYGKDVYQGLSYASYTITCPPIVNFFHDHESGLLQTPRGLCNALSSNPPQVWFLDDCGHDGRPRTPCVPSFFYNNY